MCRDTVGKDEFRHEESVDIGQYRGAVNGSHGGVVCGAVRLATIFSRLLPGALNLDHIMVIFDLSQEQIFRSFDMARGWTILKTFLQYTLVLLETLNEEGKYYLEGISASSACSSDGRSELYLCSGCPRSPCIG
jgi:hypothetical protein